MPTTMPIRTPTKKNTNQQETMEACAKLPNYYVLPCLWYGSCRRKHQHWRSVLLAL